MCRTLPLRVLQSYHVANQFNVGEAMPPEKVGHLLPAANKVLFDERLPRKERDYSRRRKTLDLPHLDLMVRVQHSCQQSCKQSSLVRQRPPHGCHHGHVIKKPRASSVTCEGKKTCSLSHMRRRNGYPERQPMSQIQRMPLQRAGVGEIPMSSAKCAGRS